MLIKSIQRITGFRLS